MKLEGPQNNLEGEVSSTESLAEEKILNSELDSITPEEELEILKKRNEIGLEIGKHKLEESLKSSEFAILSALNDGNKDKIIIDRLMEAYNSHVGEYESKYGIYKTQLDISSGVKDYLKNNLNISEEINEIPLEEAA